MRISFVGSIWSRSSTLFSKSSTLTSRSSTRWRAGVPIKAPLAEVTGKSFPAEGKNFDKYFVAPEVRKKPWDGQDKDTYFRDKYAHVHAKQKKEREERKKTSPYKAARSFTKNKLGRLEHAERSGITLNKEPNILVDKKRSNESNDANQNIRRDFTKLFTESLARDPRREFIYGTGPVLAALQADKRTILALHTRDRREDIPELIKNICKSQKLKVECNVPNAHLNIMTNNGIHNKYVLEVRPLERRQLVSLGTVWDRSDKSEEILENDKGKQKLSITGIEDGKIVPSEVAIPHNPNRKFPLVLFIDEVTDAHNFGAIIRSAYYLGVDIIAHAEKNSAKLTSVVDKTSAGAMEHIDIFNTPQPLKFFELSKENGWNIIATSVADPKGSQIEKVKPSELKHLLNSGPCMLVIGSEGEGLRTSLLQRSTHVVTWKGFQDINKLDSLNVSVATGLLLSKFYGDDAFDDR